VQQRYSYKQQYALTINTSNQTKTEETLIRQSKIAALETPSMQVLDAFNAEFEGHNPSLLGASKTMYKCDASNIWNLAQLNSTERKDRVSGFLAKHLFRWLQVNFIHTSDPSPLSI
jgi:hypothetical protein